MLDAGRLRSRMAEKGISQSELARRVGVSQQNIGHLLSGNAQGSKRLHVIARELGTTPAYLSGEVEDPDEGAPPPLPEPRHQLVTMQVLLPSEAALTRMFQGFLLSLEVEDAAELAPELAKLLPIGLGQLRGPLREEVSAEADDPREAAEAPANEGRASRRARRT